MAKSTKPTFVYAAARKASANTILTALSRRRILCATGLDLFADRHQVTDTILGSLDGTITHTGRLTPTPSVRTHLAARTVGWRHPFIAAIRCLPTLLYLLSRAPLLASQTLILTAVGSTALHTATILTDLSRRTGAADHPVIEVTIVI